MNLNLPARIFDDAAVRDHHRPRVKDCRKTTCPSRRGEDCQTPAGAFAPYHRERRQDTKDLTDAQLIAEFTALGQELAQQRTERDARMRRPLSAATLATRAAVNTAWDRVHAEIMRAERVARQRCAAPYLHSADCCCRQESTPARPVPRPGTTAAVWHGREGAQ